MSQITKFTFPGLLLFGGLLFMAGCGSSTPNSNAPFDADSGHPANWLPAGHMNSARSDESVCAECHGTDYNGGTSGISCTQCHLGGVNSVHPVEWGTSIDSAHAAYVDTNGNTACANTNCHGTKLEGVDNSGPSCTSCHLGGASAFHPVSFGMGTQALLNHASYVMANGSTGCATSSCHGVNLTGGIGPACVTCHTSGSYPFTATGCTSCHGNPPSGNVAPNRAAAHNAVAGHFSAQVALPADCNTCHNSAGAGTVKHSNGVTNVQFLNAYNAKSGTAVRNSNGTCSNVSCHGGQTTRPWYGGSMDVSTQCTSCHAYVSNEYNSFWSGGHDLHINSLGVVCTDCHDTTKLAVNHFAHLNTQVMEGPASESLNSNLNYTGGTCTPGCHATESW